MADKKDKMEEDKEPEDIRSPKVLLKYQAAGNVANDALKHVISTIKPGAKIVDACIAGDKFIRDKTSRIYNKEKTEKGIAFPTAVSVNHVVGHFSPAADSKATFSKGDLVKVDLGVHVDGYIAVAAHSFIVEGSPTGRAADVLACANHAAEAVLKLVKPGNKNSQITETINKMAAEFKVNAVQGVLSHQMKRFVIDGEKVIINKSDTEQKVDEFEFALNEVYAIDIVLSTGAGKPNEVDERATIYKKAPDTRYNLKRTVSRQVFGEIQKKFPVFPFNLRDLESKGVAFGVKEAAEHDLVIPYPVLFEKAGDLVAHLKFTVLIGSSGTSKISGLPFDKSIKTSVVIKDGGAGASGGGGAAKKKKKKPKKKKPAAGGAGGAGGAAGGAAAKEEEEEEEEEGEEPMDTS